MTVSRKRDGHVLPILVMCLLLLVLLPSWAAAQTLHAQNEPLLNPAPHITRISLLILGGIIFLVLSRVFFRLRCPECRDYIKTSSEVLVAPTSSEEGRSRTVFDCPCCDYREEREQSIPVRQKDHRPAKSEVLTGKETGDEARRRARESFKKDMF